MRAATHSDGTRARTRAARRETRLYSAAPVPFCTQANGGTGQ